MEFPPGDWFIFEVVNFETAHPSGSCPAQVHPHLRDVAGGHRLLTVESLKILQSVFHPTNKLSLSDYHRDLQPAEWPMAAAIQSKYSSTVWPVAAAIQSRHFINCVTFHGCYPVEIFSQQGGLSWLLSSRDLQSTGWPFSQPSLVSLCIGNLDALSQTDL